MKIIRKQGFLFSLKISPIVLLKYPSEQLLATSSFKILLYVLRLFSGLRKNLPKMLKKSAFFRNSQRKCSVRKGALRIAQNSQENTSARVSFLIKLQARQKKLWHRCLPVNFAKSLRTLFYRTSPGDCFYFYYDYLRD